MLATTFKPYRPVVFLHAFPLNRSMWEAQVAALAGAGFSALTLDFPGFGGSAAVEAPDLGAFAGAVLDTLNRQGVYRAAFVGLSMGGYVLFRLWEQAPERVAALVLADTRAEPDTAEARDRRLTQAGQVEQGGTAAIVDGFLQGAVGETTRRTRPDVVARVRELVLAAPPRGVIQALRALAARPDSRPLLPGISVPTLVIVGDEDALTPPEVARTMAGAIPGAALRVLPGAGHLSALEDPETFNRAILDFLAGIAWG